MAQPDLNATFRGVASALALGLALLSSNVAAERTDGSKGSGAGAATGGAVLVELFTSEGCSSCPSADAVLTELAGNRAVYALSFHVDYWNYLGWADPFSSKRYSRRQHRYARALGDRVYTPQLVVNGRRSMVGSRRQEVRQAISRARRRPPAALALNHARRGRRVTVSLPQTARRQGTRFFAVLAQRTAERHVIRGENAGETLRHSNVVRALAAGQPEETLLLRLPVDLEARDVSLYGWLQDTRSLQITATGHVVSP